MASVAPAGTVKGDYGLTLYTFGPGALVGNQFETHISPALQSCVKVNLMPRYSIIIGIALCIAAVLIAGCTQPTPPATPTPTATAPPTPVPTATPVMYAYNESADGQTVTLPLGTTFLVWLQENPTTGYSWNVTVTDGLEITNDTYIPPTSGLIGAGGSHTWNVLTVKTGVQEFSGIYMRPFENVTGNETTYSLYCNVTS
jgi:inhibitor of cysteine peptidase